MFSFLFSRFFFFSYPPITHTLAGDMSSDKRTVKKEKRKRGKKENERSEKRKLLVQRGMLKREAGKEGLKSLTDQQPAASA